MCNAWKQDVDDARAEGRAEGRASGITEGVERTKIEIAKAMLREHLSIETIEKCTGLSFLEILTLTE